GYLRDGDARQGAGGGGGEGAVDRSRGRAPGAVRLHRARQEQAFRQDGLRGGDGVEEPQGDLGGGNGNGRGARPRGFQAVREGAERENQGAPGDRQGVSARGDRQLRV